MNTYNPLFISSYHTHACNKETELPENVCKDLDVDDVFSAINFTSSCIGQQYLYHILHQDEPSIIRKYEGLINKLNEDKELRKRLSKVLTQTSNPDAYYITSLFSNSISTPSKYKLTGLSICRFIPFILAGFIFITHHVSFIFLLIGAFIINLLLHYQNKKNIYQYYHSIPQVLRLIKQAEEIVKEPLSATIDPSINETLTEIRPLKPRLRFFKLSVRMDSDMAIIIYGLVEIIHIFFLTEAYSIHKALAALSQKKELIEKIFRFVGFTDILCSVSLLREQFPYYCVPTSPMCGEKLRVDAIYHPLISNATSNDLLLYEKSFLVTGSNMSGKTCFIRTIGINLLCAKVLNTCFARHFAMELDTRIFSSIHNADSLQEGKSYFLQETAQIKRMIDRITQAPSLFLLDEPFKGTNTQERIAICRAVLSAMAKNGNTVLASTHDIELCTHLQEQYEQYYFCETIEENQLLFDYQLKKGISTQRNAIKILEINNYPEEIVKNANLYSIP